MEKKVSGDQHQEQKIFSDDFVAVDVGALALLTGERDIVAAAAVAVSPSISLLQKSLTRKGSQRGGAEFSNNSNINGAEKSPFAVHVAAEGGSSCSTTPRWGRQVAGGGRRAATWLDPRRVLFIFAALSSVGSLLLLYLTFSIDKQKD